MTRIRIRDLSGRESVPTSTRCGSRWQTATILVVLLLHDPGSARERPSVAVMVLRSRIENRAVQ